MQQKKQVSKAGAFRSSLLLRLLRLLIFCCFSFFCGRKRAKQATVTWNVTGQLYSAGLAFAVKMDGLEVSGLEDDDDEEEDGGGIDTRKITGGEDCIYPGTA